MYDLADVLPDAEVDPGTNVLFAGPPLTGKRKMAYDVLASGAKRGEGCIVVTTKDGATKIQSDVSDLLVDEESVPLGVVDCVTKQQGVGITEEDERIKYASSPVDMTGIGIKLSEFLTMFTEQRGIERNRVLLHSISTLLMYADIETVFRFLHVFTGRIQTAEALGLYVVDSTAHDDQTMNTIKQLFDAVIEIDDESSEPTFRTAGISS